MDILWIGYGKMGKPMCDRLLTGQHRIRVIDINAERRAAASAHGHKVAGDLPAAAETMTIFTSLPHDQACRSALLGPNGVLGRCRPGSVLIETSTISVETSRDIAVAAETGGVSYLRAPVSGTVTAVEAGTLATFVSGPTDIFGRVRNLISCFAATISVIGLAEEARVMKLAVNLMVHTLMVSLSEALAFCRKGGIEPAIAVEAITRSAIASPHLALKADSLLRADFRPTFTVTQTRKDLRLINDASRDMGVPLLLGAAVEQVLAALESTGSGDLDYIAHGQLIADLAGLPRIETANVSKGDRPC